MNYSAEQIDIISRYLKDHKLSLEDTEFVIKNKELPEFIKELEFQKSLNKSLQKAERISWRKRFEALDDSSLRSDKKLGTKSSEGIMIALILIGLLGLGLLIYLLNQNAPKPDVLYAKNYTEFPNLYNPLDRTVSSQALDAFQEYEQKDFSSAIDKFDLTDAPLDIVQMYRGLTQLELGNNGEAIKDLSMVIQTPNAKYREAAEWYLVFVHLKNDDLTSAKEVLVKLLENENHKYFDVAKQLLTEF